MQGVHMHPLRVASEPTTGFLNKRQSSEFREHSSSRQSPPSLLLNQLLFDPFLRISQLLLTPHLPGTGLASQWQQVGSLAGAKL